MREITSEQLQALKELKELMNKYEMNFVSEDPYCGVDIVIGSDYFSFSVLESHLE